MTNTIYQKLSAIQVNLKAPKGQRNNFGKYNYRSCEDILEALKPLLDENQCIILLSDEVKEIETRVYVEATATLIDAESGEKIEVSAYAREPLNKKGQDESQITGSTSSYARKYALNGMFAIDDTKDEDTNELRNEKTQRNNQKPATKREFTLDEALKIPITFGEYKGKNALDVALIDPDYLKKLRDKAKSDIYKKAFQMVLDQVK